MLRLKLIRLFASKTKLLKRRIPDPWTTPPEAIKVWRRNNPNTYSIGEVQGHFGVNYVVVSQNEKYVLMEKM